MRVREIEQWCRTGDAGTIGRTLLLPLSYPRQWEPAPLPEKLTGFQASDDDTLQVAKQVFTELGLPIAVGFVLLEERPDEPLAHVFNACGTRAIDVALHRVPRIGYWAYLPTPAQLEIDSASLAAEGPSADDLRALLVAPG